MKFQSITKTISNEGLTVLNSKTVQIKKVTSFTDMLELKNKFSSLKRAVQIGEKIFVEEPQNQIPIQ